MRRREINWLITIVFIGILTGVAIKSWQYWQRNHFQCSGELRLFSAGYQGDISLRYVGNDSNLLIVFYVQIMPDDFVMQLHRF